jgi:hypothetical protein
VDDYLRRGGAGGLAAMSAAKEKNQQKKKKKKTKKTKKKNVAKRSRQAQQRKGAAAAAKPAWGSSLAANGGANLQETDAAVLALGDRLRARRQLVAAAANRASGATAAAAVAAIAAGGAPRRQGAGPQAATGDEDAEIEAHLEQLQGRIAWMSRKVAQMELHKRERRGGDREGSDGQEALRRRREQLVALYAAHDPSRLGKVDALLDKFSEQELKGALSKKYGQLPEGWGANK